MITKDIRSSKSIIAPNTGAPAQSKPITSADLHQAAQRAAPEKIVEGFRLLLSQSRLDLDRLANDLMGPKFDLRTVREGLRFAHRLEAALNAASAAAGVNAKR